MIKCERCFDYCVAKDKIRQTLVVRPNGWVFLLRLCLLIDDTKSFFFRTSGGKPTWPDSGYSDCSLGLLQNIFYLF